MSQTFIGGSGPITKMTWTMAPSNMNLTTREQFEHAMVQEKTWAIVASTSYSVCIYTGPTHARFSVNQGATDRLNQVLSSGSGPYDGTSAVTFYANEARGSNAV